MICPRCADEKIEVMATSPVKGVWTVYQCQHCLYTWRDTEPLRRTSREHYPEAFRRRRKISMRRRRCRTYRRYCRKISVNERGPLSRAFFIFSTIMEIIFSLN